MLKISSLLNEISKDKIIEIQIEVNTIPSLMNEIQMGMHTPLLNEIFKIQIGMHAPLLNKIFKTKIFIVSPTTTLISKDKIIEIQIEVNTIPSLMNEIFKGKIFEIHIEIFTIP